jgi:hypothetical protein
MARRRCRRRRQAACVKYREGAGFPFQVESGEDGIEDAVRALHIDKADHGQSLPLYFQEAQTLPFVKSVTPFRQTYTDSTATPPCSQNNRGGLQRFQFAASKMMGFTPIATGRPGDMVPEFPSRSL